LRERALAVVVAASTLLGAWLVFFVQPMAAKWLLPGFGGSPATWGACLVFFQSMLLAGYAYVHLGARWLSVRAQAVLHLVVIGGAGIGVLSASVLGPPPSAAGQGAAWLPLVIASALARQVGAACFVLSCTAPLAQRWVSVRLQREPYGLYALSNLGSLGALLAYPFLVEPALGLHAQHAWFVRGFGVLCALVAWLAIEVLVGVREEHAHAEVASAAAPVEKKRVASWLVLSALPSALLVAATNHITTDVAATPLFWVTPLALYLGTYVLAFRAGGIGPHLRSAALGILLVASVLVGWGSFAQGSASLVRQLLASLGVLLGAALLCHDALVRARPAPEQLTWFYLSLAAGGVLGSLSVSVVAPLVLDDYYELELSVLAVLVVLVALRASFSAGQRRALFLGIGLVVPLLSGALIVRAGGDTKHGVLVARMRSFLGPLRVTQLPEGRVLTHGRIRHGMQLTAADLRDRPTMYFGPGTALARVLGAARDAQHPHRRLGIVGLGVGTLAAYAREGDELRFYELDPNVLELAQRDFTFLRDTRAHVAVSLGDGRLSLAQEPPHAFDVLALDAFSSDAVPVHLLTREAFATYVRQLAPDGVLLSNVSNRHLEVERVVQASARAVGLACRVIETPSDEKQFVSKVRWAVMARSRAQLDALLQGMSDFPSRGPELLWTDERASVLPILR
jgi:hypothetical protein